VAVTGQWATGPGYMAVGPCDGFTYVGHDRGTPAVVGGGAMGNHGGVAGGVATAVANIVAVLARRARWLQRRR
jgi:hypothetical protein